MGKNLRIADVGDVLELLMVADVGGGGSQDLAKKC